MLENSKARPQAKIEEWKQPLTQTKIEGRIKHYTNYKNDQPDIWKLSMWEKISGNTVSEELIQNFSDKKQMKWERKLEKINLEIKSNKLTMLTSGVKVAALIAVSATTIYGVGVPAAMAFAAVMGLIEGVGGCKNYFMKNSLDGYKFKPVLF